ncbi:Hypothetical protein, putative [Bodo saltans]|uniref:Uncharacterized protein n=1 Tax=Bodo saltans TaxID=75058 RepID=A0A0S4KEH1_BODSA|nr:Hypothetical protein, putative [Bodo saltans]|eukprot:CUI14096.1 Hypothetical protein, putative [Bodo saltans]
MASFKERFKDKASVVGKDGSNAMLSPSQQPYLPNPQQQVHAPPYQPQQVPLSQKQQMSYLQLHQEDSSTHNNTSGGWGSPPPVIASTVAMGKVAPASFGGKQPSRPIAAPAPVSPPLQQQQQAPPQALPNKRAQLPIAPIPQQIAPASQQQQETYQQPPQQKLPLQFPPQRQQQQPQHPVSSKQPPSSFVPTGLFQQIQQPQQQQLAQHQQYAEQQVQQQQAPPPKSGSFAFAGAGGFQPTGMIPSNKPNPQQQQHQQFSEAPSNKKTSSGVGSYNYGAASGAVGSSSSGGGGGNDQSDERSSPKKGRGGDGGIRFGRRAGSSDGTTSSSNVSKGVAPRRDASRNRISQHDEGERPRTDPSAIVVETSPSRREVHYTPYNVNDYRRMKEELEKKQSRGLGPSDTDEQRAAAQRVQRQKEYAENIKRVNQVLMPAGSPSSGDQDEAGMPAATRAQIVQPVPVEVIEKQKMRERANEYAKRVPKPKPKAAPQQATDNSEVIAERAEELWGVGEAETKKHEKERHIADLEARHLQDQQMVANLKKQLRI